MAVVLPGEGVIELIRSATNRIFIAAPYIKSPSICRLLDAAPNTLSECICVTRWLPEDIASGVCDLEIFEDVLKVKGGQLLVHPHLHAKYYSNGQQSLVGSANLTARGLGWHTPSNVELLVSLPADFPGLVEWEQKLLSSSVTATNQLRERIRAKAEQLEQTGPLHYAPEVEKNTEEEKAAVLWVPLCPVPDRLWEVYCGRGADRMVSSAFEAAQKDLAALSPPSGLTEDLFTAYIAGILRQMPLLTEIDKLAAAAGLTDTKAYEFLAERLVGVNDHKQHWRIIKLWLVHFFPSSYRLETGQEVLVKGRELPPR